MHAVLGGLHYKGPEGALRIETLDAPVVALGEKHPWYFTRNQPDLSKGFHFNLFNNAGEPTISSGLVKICASGSESWREVSLGRSIAE